jgi:hypothetical protein
MNYDDDIVEELDYLEREKIKYNKFLKEEAIKLELGKTYLQESSSWAKMHYKIVFVDDKIALGIVVYCGIYNSTNRGNCGEYEMFKVTTGEKYSDCRLEYRLKKEV